MKLLQYTILTFLMLQIQLATAQNSTTATSIDIHATFHNIGVQVNITGDDNNNAKASMEANINGAGFIPVHDLSKLFLDVNAYGNYPARFVGSVFSVNMQTTVEVRVTINDPDGVTNPVSTASITTRSKQIPTSSGNEIHVAITGNNTTGDGSFANPYVTIQHALDQSVIGDSILIHAGTYHESIEYFQQTPNSSQAYTTIKSAGDGQVIMDGTDFTTVNANTWTDEGKNVYSAPLNSLNNETYYVGFDGRRLFKYFSLSDLQNLIHATDGGFYSDAASQKVFVKLPGDSTIIGHQMTVSNLKNAIVMYEVFNLVINEITFINFNSAEHANAIHVTDNSNNVWIVNSKFEHMQTPIRLEARVNDLVVMNNEFSDQGINLLDWNTVKDHQHWLERGALFCSNDEYSGQGIIFSDNYVHEMFDGVKIVGQEILTFASNSDVENNRFLMLSDDGVETDGYSSNVRIQNNRFETLLIGVSVAPALAGPTYITRNLMVDMKNLTNTDWQTGAVKFSIGDEIYGDIFIYHNTGATTEANREAFSVSNEADWTHLVMKNNIWSGTSYGIYYFLDNAPDFKQDYDLLYATSNIVAQYSGEDYNDIAGYFSASGVCEHCVEGLPQFTNQVSGNYHLEASSPAINQATLIPGINYLDINGNLPDIGRYEWVEDFIFKNGFE